MATFYYTEWELVLDNKLAFFIYLSVKNIASQAMIEKNGFVVRSRWTYCYISTTPGKLFQKPETGQARIATSKDKEMICNYLKQSQIFRAAAENYVEFWRWYHLDLGSGVLQTLIDDKKVMIIMDTNHSIIVGSKAPDRLDQ